jgi:hypothetical protein
MIDLAVKFFPGSSLFCCQRDFPKLKVVKYFYDSKLKFTVTYCDFLYVMVFSTNKGKIIRGIAFHWYLLSFLS